MPGCLFDSSLKKDKDYALGVELGEGLAKGGFHIMNGGYMGSMEAVSKGAAKVKGTEIIGVVVPTVFPSRKNGNEFLTQKIEAKCIEERVAKLVADAGAFVVLPGSLGTLTELIMAWNTAVLAPLSGKKPPPVIAFKEPWEDIMKSVATKLCIPKQLLDMIVFVASAKEAVEKVAESLLV
uniref:Cytokinin riboside 5'-monophosphate phosphoribohydrolase n=1 Tax=Lotharella globosa TaxID=91324 RepID=A0A7S3Z841_9EUKA